MASAATNRRQDAATATVGYTLIGTGAALRHSGLSRAHHGKIPGFKWSHPIQTNSIRGLVRRGAKGRARYASGATLGLLGTPPAAVGTYGLLHNPHNPQKEPASKSLGYGVVRRSAKAKAGVVARNRAKIPRGRLTFEHSQDKYFSRTQAYLRGRHIGGVSTDNPDPEWNANRVISDLGVKPGFRRRNVASNLLHAHEQFTGEQVHHSPSRSPLGDAFAEAHGKRTGALVPKNNQMVIGDERTERFPGRLHVARPSAGMTRTGIQTRKPQFGKRDDRKHHSFLGEGIRGTDRALHQRAENLRQPVPAGVRLGATGLSTGIGAGASVLTHRILDRARPATKLRHPLAAAAGVAAGTVSLPVTSRVMRRVTGYEMTPAGVKRRRKPPVRPSKHANVVETRANRGGLSPMRARHQIVPSDPFGKADKDYAGLHTPKAAQRAAVTGAGAVPLIGSITSARMASHFAPPDKGERRKAALRQYASTAGSTAAGVGGAYGLAHAVERSPRAEQMATRAAHLAARTKAKITRRPPKKVTHSVPKFIPRAIRESKVGKPLFSTNRRLLGTMVGYHAAKTITGQAMQQTAISRNLSAQDRYNRKHGLVRKLQAPPAALTPREQRQQLERRKRKFVADAAMTTLGATGLGLYLAGHAPKVPPKVRRKAAQAALVTPVLAGGVGTYGGIKNLQISRRDIRQRDHELASKSMPRLVKGPPGVFRAKTYRPSFYRRTPPTGRLVRVRAGVR